MIRVLEKMRFKFDRFWDLCFFFCLGFFYDFSFFFRFRISSKRIGLEKG